PPPAPPPASLHDDLPIYIRLRARRGQPGALPSGARRLASALWEVLSDQAGHCSFKHAALLLGISTSLVSMRQRARVDSTPVSRRDGKSARLNSSDVALSD